MWRLILVFVVAAQAQPPHPPPHGGNLTQAFQQYLNHAVFRTGVGVQLSYKDSRSEITVAAGKAGSRPTRVDDAFLFGSGTKPVTAALLLKRVEEGRLGLNDTVASYLDKPFKAKANQSFVQMFGQNATTLTVWHLLSMQAGVPDFDVPAFDKKVLDTDATTPFKLIQYASTQPWACQPGQCVFYSSTNYILLGFVLLALDGKGCDEWADLQQAVIAPTVFNSSNFATNGTLNGSGLSVPAQPDIEPSKTIFGQRAAILGWTCGNLIASSRDMARFFYELLIAKTVLSEPMLKLMTDVRDISLGFGKNGRYIMLKYGAGLMAQQEDFFMTYHEDRWNYGDWGTTMGHGGDTYGFASDQGFIPQLNATFSWVANTEETGDYVSYFISCNVIKIAAKMILGKDPPGGALHCDYPISGNDHGGGSSGFWPPPPQSSVIRTIDTFV